MFKLLHRLPKKLTVALSGGVDSVCVTDFLARKHDVSCAFFHHGTEASEKAEAFVQEFCEQRSLPLVIGRMDRERAKGESPEEFWRIERMKFLHSLDEVVVTGHNLDDVMETWIFTSLHGQSKLIPAQNGNVLRSFLCNPKQKFVDWSQRHELPFCYDETNDDTKYMRNLIRHKIVPEALKVNPGLGTVLRKKLLKLEMSEYTKDR